MARETRVTIVIPTFNRCELLRCSIGSVLAQDHDDFRLIVLDNASTDGTEEATRSFGDDRVTYLRNEVNIGLFRNWNRAIAVNSSEYLCILQDDDIVLPNFLTESVKALDRYPEAAFSSALARYIDIDGTPLSLQDTRDVEDGVMDGLEYLHRIVAGHNWVIHFSTVLLRAAALARVGPFDAPHSKHAIDFNLYLRIAARYKLTFIRKELAHVRRHVGQDIEIRFRSRGGTGPLAVMAERQDAIGYLMQSSRARDESYRLWLAERLLDLNMRRSELTQDFAPDINLSWNDRLEIAKEEISSMVPAGEKFILADDGQWGMDIVPGRQAIPFPERGGKYWGVPENDEAAVLEVGKMESLGARFLVVGWPAFWWLDYFSGLRSHLTSALVPLLKNSRLAVFGRR